jgi:hypothetical protein
MKKIIYICIIYYFIHIALTALTLPFLVSFGSGSWLKNIVLMFTDFPLRYSDESSGIWFMSHYLLNSLFWSVVLGLLLMTGRSIKIGRK